ncbi:alcohol dehydrogenase catalytic domain-containing protein [Alicyclobacillus fodiniaquatilis]|uniref:Alcohol dehydrogenase catalytic domain-containing protein n=1 Tax=Alicyclobacillus fodiniaquatilis TaxID=1661150 RepID=A0ABW4JL58_9BACL
MRAVEFSPDKGFQVVDVALGSLAADEVRLQVEACGVCGSDRQVVQGESVPPGTSFPLVMGHEIAGTVTEVGEQVKQWQVGDEVIVHPFISCGTCAPCQHNQPNLCVRQTCIGYQQAGGFAEMVTVPASQLVRRPKGCDAAAAALLVDAFATPYHAMRLADVAPGSTVLVIGTGGLGLAALRLAGAFAVGRLGAVTRRDAGLDSVAAHGAEMVVSMQDEPRNVARQMRRWSGAGGIDVVIDTVANKETVKFALDVVRPGGAVTLIGMSEDDAVLPIAKSVRRGVRLLTSYGSELEDVRALSDWVAAGRLDPSVLLAGTLALEEVEQAFSPVRASGRWVITPRTL